MSGLEDLKGRIFSRLGNHSVIYLDGKGGFRQRFVFPADLVLKDYWPSLRRPFFGCRALCNYHKPITRLHVTCLHCRVRRVYEGKFSMDYPVDLRLYTINRASNRRFCRLKNKLIHYLSTVCEALAD